MELNKPFSVPAILRAETSAAEDENHWVSSLQFGELPTFRGVIGKFIVGEDCPGNNVRSHIQPPFWLKHDHSSLFVRIYAGFSLLNSGSRNSGLNQPRIRNPSGLRYPVLQM